MVELTEAEALEIVAKDTRQRAAAKEAAERKKASLTTNQLAAKKAITKAKSHTTYLKNKELKKQAKAVVAAKAGTCCGTGNRSSHLQHLRQ